jgi:uncharacterized membrane-anchored protein
MVIAGLLVADLLVFGGWIASLEWSRRSASVRLPIEGYDPRDLLSGHYVRFRLVAEREATELMGPQRTELDENATLRFCLEVRGGLLHVKRRHEIDDTCQPFLAGQWRDGRLQTGADRFYVDERRADEVAWVEGAPDTYVVATLDGAGRPGVVDLVVKGKSLGKR